MIRKNAKICALVLAMVMMLSTVAFAAEGDHFTKDGKLVYNRLQVRADVDARNHVRAVPKEFKMEVNGELYDLVNVNEAYAKDKDNWKEILKGEEPASDLKVVEVSAINAKEIKVTFSKAVKESTVISNVDAGTLETGVFTITPLTTDGVAAENPGVLTGKLSKDGKELVLTATDKFDGRYDFNIAAEKITDLDGNKLPSYAKIITIKDTVRPTLTKVSYGHDGTDRTVTLEFSEPVDATNLAILAKRVDGVALNASTTIDKTKATTIGNKIVIKLDAVNAVDQGKDIKLTLTNLVDFAGNLVSPNPLTTTIKYDVTDTTAPTVKSIIPKSSTSFSIKFSEEVVLDTTANNITIGSTPTDVTDKAKVDAKDATVVNVTGITTPVTGIQKVQLAAGAVKDLAGNPLEAYDELVNFSVDTEAPKVVSTEVKTINKVHFLIVNYDKEVTPDTSKNVTLTTKKANGETDIKTVSGASLYNPVGGKSKAIQVNLSTLTEGATYTAEFDAELVSDAFGNKSKVVKDIKVVMPGEKVVQEMKAASSNISLVPAGAGIPANRILKVEFKHELDVESAETASNYTVEGAKVEKAEINQNSGTDFNVYVTLAEDSVKVDGNYLVTVKNVKAKDGLALEEPYTENVDLTENIRPTVKSAKFTDTNTDGDVTEITLTFSENVKATDASLDIFEIFVGSSKTASAVTNVDLSSNTDNEVVLTVTTPLTAEQVAEGVTVKLAEDNEEKIIDSNDNILKFESIKAGF